jgi:adenylate cyclase
MGLKIEEFNELLLETVGIGLVIVSWPDLRLMFRNSRVTEWIPGFDDVAEAELCDRIPGIDKAVLCSAIESEGSYSAAIEVKAGRRTLALFVTMSRISLGNDLCLIVELYNNTKVRKLETMISSYSKMVEDQNRALRKEKERAEKLLLNIMPESVYKELKTFGVTTPQRYDEASILMLDFVGFTQLSLEHDPATIITELNDIFTGFDRIAERQGCERIKTIGDAYVAVSGLPEPASDHAASIARLALMCIRFLNRRNETHSIQWKARVGLAPGPVIGSVVGIQKYVYDIFGPGINLAARLEALAGPMDILVSEGMYATLKSQFQLEALGPREIRGFGEQPIYRLLGAENLSMDIEPSLH